MRRDTRMARRPVSNSQTIRRLSERPIRSTRVNDKPYHRPMAAMDFEDTMDWEEPNRYSPSPVNKINFFYFNYYFYYMKHMITFLDNQTKFGERNV